MSAFTSQFTTQVGSSKNAQQCYAVIADSYEASMHELAQVLSAQLGENERPAYVANILQECRKILPAPDSGEAITDEQRLQCLSLLTSDITKAAFNAVSQADTEGFVNMYLTLATPISDRLSDINAHVELFTTLLNTPSSLTTLLYILPSAINDKARLRIYEKMLTLVPADQRNATLKALFVQLPTWSTSTEDTDAFCMRTTEHWLKKGDPKMCESILRHAESSNSDLQRLRLRLALQSTTCFDFPSAPEATQENAVVEYLVSRDQQASIDENVLTSALPKLSKEALATKKTSLAIARMFSARIGHKVGYSSIAQEVLSLASTTASDELDESVEGAVIDAIKSKLVQARLSQPTRTVTVISSAYSSILPALPASANSQSKAEREKEQWVVIQRRLQGLRANLDSLAAGMDSILGASAKSTAQERKEVAPTSENVASSMLSRAGDLVGAGKPVEVS